MSSNVKHLIRRLEAYISGENVNERLRQDGKLGILLWNLILTNMVREGDGFSHILDKLCRGIEGLLVEWPEYVEPHLELCKKLSVIAAETSKAYLRRYYNFQTFRAPCDCTSRIEEADASTVKRAIFIISQIVPTDPSQELVYIEAMMLPLAVHLTQSKFHWLQWRTGLCIWEYLVKQGKILEMPDSRIHFIPFIVTCLRRRLDIKAKLIEDPTGEEKQALKEILPALFSATVAMAESGYEDDGNPKLFYDIYMLLYDTSKWSHCGEEAQLFAMGKILKNKLESLIRVVPPEKDHILLWGYQRKLNRFPKQDTERTRFIYDTFMELCITHPHLFRLNFERSLLRMKSVLEATVPDYLSFPSACVCRIKSQIRSLMSSLDLREAKFKDYRLFSHRGT